jgi:hypothetical protein
MSTLTRRGLIGVAAAAAAVGTETATAAPARKASPAGALDETLGHYISTMSPANTGAANAAAFEADVAAADGAQILVLPDPTPYTVGAVEITGATINVRFMPGARLVPDAGLHAVGGRMFLATDCDTRLYGMVVDGLNRPENCWRSNGGQFRAYDTEMANMGFLDIPGTTSSLGTAGILCKGVDEVIIDGYVGRDFVGRKDDVFANNAGKVNHLFIYECERVAIRNVTISGGEGEDNDFFHILDLRPTPTMHGTIESCHLYYNGQTRRCLKFQGGNWDVRDVHCYPGPDFASVNPAVTDVGEQNLNCVDWAGSVAGELRISDSFIDATGFVVGLSHSFGPLGRVVAENCRLVGGRRHAIRTNPEPPHNAQDLQTMGMFAAPADNESEIRDCTIAGFSRSVVVQGNRTRVVGNTIDDPQDLWFQGGSSTARDFLELRDNKVYTRTGGAMAAARCARIDNYSNIECHDNTLIRAGNTTHASVFIDLTNANAVGFATGNRAPSGTVSFRSGAANVAVYQNQGHLLRPLLTTAAAGNVGTGETTLQSHLIPAYNVERVGAAVRTTFTGTTTNNANAKTLRVYVGTSLVMTRSLAAGQAGVWEVEILLISLGSNAQKYTVRCLESSTASGLAVGTLAEVSSASIIVKVTGQGVASNDIAGQTGVSESLEGRHFIFT